MDDGREAYTRNPVFLCWFNQIKSRNAKNRRTLNRAAPFRSFFVEKKKKKVRPRYFRHPSGVLSRFCRLTKFVSSVTRFFFSFFFFLKENRLEDRGSDRNVFEKEQFWRTISCVNMYVCMYTYAGIFGIFWKKLEEIGRNFGGFYSGIVSIFLFMRKMSNELVIRIVELKKVWRILK